MNQDTINQLKHILLDASIARVTTQNNEYKIQEKLNESIKSELHCINTSIRAAAEAGKREIFLLKNVPHEIVCHILTIQGYKCSKIDKSYNSVYKYSITW